MTEQSLDGRVTGGCQCGAVRYAIAGSPKDRHCSVCHCRMCQKASGGPFMVFVSVPVADIVWTRGERAVFASSSIASRGFCRDCGTPLTYERSPERLSVAHGTLDDPALISPTSQLVDDSMLPWSTGGIALLPAEQLSDWLAKLPDPIKSHQQPDRDS